MIHANIPQGGYVDGYRCLRSQRLPWLRMGGDLKQLYSRSSCVCSASFGRASTYSNDYSNTKIILDLSAEVTLMIFSLLVN